MRIAKSVAARCSSENSRFRKSLRSAVYACLLRTYESLEDRRMLAHGDFDISSGIYRIPYADGTSVTASNDHHNHPNAFDRVDLVGGEGTTIVAAASGIIRGIVDRHGESPNPGDGLNINGDPDDDGPEHSCTDDDDVVGDCSDYNNYVWIEHPNGEWTKYTHLGTGTVTANGWEVGDHVKVGDVLGLESDVGSASGSHVHFQVSVPNDPDDPQPFGDDGGFITGADFVTFVCDIDEPNLYVDNEDYTANPCEDQEDSDRFEMNDLISTATVLGSVPKVTLRDLSIHNGTDVDYFQYTAPKTGKLIVNMFFDSEVGDINVQVGDVNGLNVMATGTESNIAPGLDAEQFVIPVVSQEKYYISVWGSPNTYDLEIENFAAPVPIAVDLAAADDTGMMDDDDVTSEDEGTITVLADLFDFADMGIDILTQDEIDAEEPGAAVEVFVRGQSVGFAERVSGSQSTLFNYQFAGGDLSEGLNFVTAAVRIFDGQQDDQGEPDRADGRTQVSVPLLLTLDTTGPATPAAPNLLASSDTGMDDSDNVTNKMQPAFDGSTERNAKVRVKADGVVVGQGIATSQGNWEVTVEPLDDAVYDMTVEVEDLAGNVSQMSEALQIEIDTLAPNTAHLDLVEADDSGRHNDDNITNENQPLLSATTHDSNASSHLFDDNFKYRIYDRLEESTEVLLYDSFDQVGYTDRNRISTTANVLAGGTILGPLQDGIHNLKLEVEDRAGNISHDFLLDLLIDTVAPTGTVNLHPSSDTGIWGFSETMGDLITSDQVPLLFGAAEANALVRVALDIGDNPPDDGTPNGTAVALPYDGDDAFPPPDEFDGNYFLQTIVNLDDGEHTLTAFFRDVAGNETPAEDAPKLTIFIDTQGPKITNVTRGSVSTDNFFSFDGQTSLFEPKPSETGPDPLVHSIVVHFSDLPDRSVMFDYDALLQTLAEEEGNYQLMGDHNGNIAIVEVNATFTTQPDDGLPETAEVELVLDQPLPDDRYTLWVSDSIADPAGNPLDGESGAEAPFDGNDVPEETPPIFPTGDGEHGGAFHGRFTIDSRPEIGTFALGTTYLDINGNFVFDPEGKDRDYTNRDIVFQFGLRDDLVFAGNFAAEGALTATGYDKLGAYGVGGGGNGAWRWRLDFDHDGVIDFEVLSGKQIAGAPFAGDFDPAHPGDEIGLFDGSKWFLDTSGNNNIGDPSDAQLQGDMRGFPIVGDFDGDGLDDVSTWNPGNQGLQTQGRFEFDLAANGLSGDVEQVIEFDLAGVFERPVAADMNGDGIDDVGLFVTRREGVPPEESGEWFFLISDDPSATPGAVTALDHAFTPIPFGTDVFAQFGDEMALPVVGNFDPPTAPLSAPIAGDVNLDGNVTFADFTTLSAYFGQDEATREQGDLDGDGRVSFHDFLILSANFGYRSQPPNTTDSDPVVAQAALAIDQTLAEMDDEELTDLAIERNLRDAL